MKNKITIIVLSLIMLIFTSTSFACNFQISQFGDPKEKIVIEPVPLSFPDQFGGEKGKKFMQRRFKELLLSISNFNIDKQKQVLKNEFISWKGELEQLDDICVIGIEI